MTATLLRDDRGRQVLRLERRLGHPVEHVWPAVSDPAELAEWFPAAVTYEPRVGAPMHFDFGGGFEQTGELLAYAPPRELAFRWGDDELRFELTPADDGCLLVFTHAFAPEAGRPARDGAGWEACFDALARALAGEPGQLAPEAARAAWAKAYEAHLARLGDVVVDVGEWGPERSLRLFGPKFEVAGRDALAAHLVPPPPGGEDPVVVVVREPGARLLDGTAVEIRAGTPGDPGDVLATGVLRDPLTASVPAT